MVLTNLGFPGGSAGKESACNAGDLGLIPGLGGSPGEGNGHPLQYSGLENSIDYSMRSQSQTRLSSFHFDCHFQREQYVKCLWRYKCAFPQCSVMGLTNFKDKWQASPCLPWNSLADLECPRSWMRPKETVIQQNYLMRLSLCSFCFGASLGYFFSVRLLAVGLYSFLFS